MKKKRGDRLLYNSFRIQKWQRFSESDRRGLLRSCTILKALSISGSGLI